MQIGIKADQQKIPDWWAIPVSAHLRKRRAKEKMTIFAGQTAVCFSVSMLAILISVLIFTGSSAFFKTHVIVEVSIPQNFALIDPYEANYRSVVFEGLYRLFPNVTSRRGKRGLQKILSQNSPYLLRNYVQRNNDLIGKTFVFDVPMSDRYSQMYKSLRKGGDVIGKKGESIQIKRLLTLRGMEVITRKFNTGLFKNADSRLPETAGLLGAIKGSFMTLLVCFSFSFPVGIGAGIFLQEMLRKGPIANFIEINSNNLAAVPSVVFGLLSLSILLNTFGLPRSSALVGGITLAIMTLPVIIIATRNGLQSVPLSVREAALSLGASRQQLIFHHLLPASMPNILTGTIIGMAQALGETAPLLLIGMNAFLTKVPEGILSPSATLPTQIYIWADSPERGFMALTSAAILVLLLFLIGMNAVAVYLRYRYEEK